MTAGACVVQRINWYVFVILPNGDLNTAADAAEPLALPIADALATTTLTLERWEPWQYVIGADAVPAIRYTAFD